jgi:YrbI family 3-deoxy-D-manno-octulosonate 8-phosphate phosphatase
MKKIAVIPLRAGSKGIKNKNKLKLLGRPLFTWVLGEAIFSNLDEVYIFTDDQWIIDFVNQEYSWTPKVKVHLRSNESATDIASTEMALLELAQHLDFKFDMLFLLQATSPLTSSNDINKAIEILEGKEYDSVLSVVKTHRFIWSKQGKTLNYDYLNRPRRQEFEGLLVENGAVYGIKTDTYKKTKNRLGGNIGILEMADDTLTEIDEISDFLVIEKLLAKKISSCKKSVNPIRVFVMDVDGVFTDGTVSYTNQGELSKSFSLIDGMGISLLNDHGITPVVITSENSEIVTQRMKKLGIENTYLGVKDKYSFLSNFLLSKNLTRGEVSYIGDDINDLANLYSSKLSFSPANATNEALQASDLNLKKEGAKGAIREAIEILIKFNLRFT